MRLIPSGPGTHPYPGASMKLLQALVVAASLLAPAPALMAAPAKQIPVRDFFKNPEQTGHQVSTDGRYLSWLAPWERRLNVFVRPIGGGEAVRVTSETARDIAGYTWKGDRIIYVKDFGGDENFHVVSVDLRGGDLKDLTPGEKVKAEIVDILWEDDGHIIASNNRR